MKWLAGNKETRRVLLIIRLLLGGLICLLCIFDAPEYTRCTHVGVCEFLEICADISNTQKSKTLKDLINRVMAPRLLPQNHIGRFLNFFSWLKNIIYKKGVKVVQNFYTDFIHPLHQQILHKGIILYRWINKWSDAFYKILSSPIILESNLQGEQKCIFFLKYHILPSLHIKIITTSIIRS